MSRERDRHSSRSSRNHDYLIKLAGISNLTNKDDIKKFLHPCHIVTIHLFDNNGNSSSECLADLESDTDVRNALKKTNSMIGTRYIEVSRATNYEYNFFTKHKGAISWHDPVIRMNGLPYTCTMADVQNFFKDIPIARNGIYITRDMSDNACGGGYVAFVSMDNAYKAIDIYNQNNIQHRYIDLLPSSYDEAKKTITNDAHLNGKRFAGENDEEEKKKNTNNNNNNGRNQRSRSKRRSRSNSRDRYSRPIKRRRSSTPKSSRSRSRPQTKDTNPRSRDNYRRRSRSRSPVQRSSVGHGEYLIKMRGMPFTVTEDEIRKFFPSMCKPVRIEILENHRTKRPNGDGHVYFNSMEEVDEAMKCHKKYLGNRYVELYFDPPRISPSPEHQRSKSKSKSKSKSHESPERLSRSPSKPITPTESRSRSESLHELI